MSKVIDSIRNHPGFNLLSVDRQEGITAVEFKNDAEADEYNIYMTRILDGEVAAANRKQKSSEVNYHNEVYENDSSGEEWTPDDKPKPEKKPSKKEQAEVENLAKRLKALTREPSEEMKYNVVDESFEAMEMRMLALKLPDVPKTPLYGLKKILRHRKRKGKKKMEYLISWVGIDPNTKKNYTNTWETEDNIPEEFIDEYHNG